MSHLRTLTAAICVVVACEASAQEAVIVARASGPQLDTRLVTTVARTFEAKQLTGPLLEAAPRLTTVEVITRLCGSFNEAYYGEFERQNGGEPRSRTDPLGANADKLIWPACLRVADLGPTNAPPTGPTTAADAYQALVGTSRQAIGGSGGNPLAFLRQRATFVASPVELTPLTGVTKDQAIAALRANDVAVSPDAVTELRGQIVEAVDLTTVDPGAEASQACPAFAAPFDPMAVHEAYAWSAARRAAATAQPGVANIYVVDNGFFGANPYAQDPYSEAFPQRLFTGWTAEPGRVGPVTSYGAEKIYPINYADAGSVAIVPDVVAAHGTHVAGLTLGGPDFRSSRDELLFKTAGIDPLQLTVINLGRGKKYLVANSQDLLRELLKKAPAGAAAPTSKIVNLSVAYDGPQAKGVFQGIFAESPGALFVVAAGNSATPADVSPGQIFPAALGNRDNVMTVAAHDVREPAQLSWFSNYGKDAVDITGPGCGVKSWLNMAATGEVSGTSQATPVAVFQSAMLATLDNTLTPFQLKARAIASGDLLGGGAARWNVVSGSKLNIPEALLLFDDVLEVLPPKDTRQPDDKAEIWIGDITEIWSLRCTTDTAGLATGRPRATLWGLKAQGDEAFLFSGRDVDRFHPPCAAAKTAPGSELPLPFVRFVRRARMIDSKIVPDAAPLPPQDVGFDRLQKVVFRGPHRGRP